ncbi:MAG TPA: pantetheine-phosphate adenylyltransferase [Candidatus Polarisedimenticolia bacterium]|jgi:pantetheine-phosphate adenylyltransferase|nr:pantetheine-phosphate adenylyltransferase [Candidatus Polarisedimenticolia bacterium]
MQTTAIYPGTFDPITNGHLDVIERSARLFDRLIVALLRNADKAPLLTLEERQEVARRVVEPYSNVSVESFDGLLVDYCRARGARAIVRGLRALSDFEYEFQMALMNRRLEPGVETVFMMPSEAYSYVSSRLVKEVAQLGGDVSGLVPPAVLPLLRRKR